MKKEFGQRLAILEQEINSKKSILKYEHDKASKDQNIKQELR